jgi:hypothetical protein
MTPRLFRRAPGPASRRCSHVLLHYLGRDEQATGARGRDAREAAPLPREPLLRPSPPPSPSRRRARGTVPHTIPEQHGLAPARVTIAEDSGHELPGHPGPLRDPGERDAPHLDLPGRQAPGSPAAARHKGMHARLSAGRQAGNRRQRGPSVAVRGKPAVTPTARQARPPSAMRPWTPQRIGLQRYKVTHHETEKNGPHSREFPASGPSSQVVAGVGFEPT